MTRESAALIAAVTVNLVAAIALNFATSLLLAWVLFSVISAATAVTLYGVWRVRQEAQVSIDPFDRTPELRKPSAIGAVSSSERGFRCCISDKSGLLVTYVGSNSCELFRLLDAIREFRRPVDSAQ